ARLAPDQLAAHFRARRAPRLPPGFEEAASLGAAPARGVPEAAGRDEALRAAEEITGAGRWPLLGFGTLEFGADVDWLRDPVSGARWPLEYHADVRLARGGGSDVRVLWELNRLAHLSALARACALTGEGRFADELLRQLRSWRAQNPLGFGPNWACAMEVALRAVNLLAAFRLLAPHLKADALRFLLDLLAEHGAHVRRNLEFSHVRTSNHYLTDVAGLFWLGVCLPELEEAGGWREWAARELPREMDGQVLSDGADWEASTGYHRYAAELFLSSFVLARENGVRVEERHRARLRAMLEYTRAILRPDGRAPLVGDADGGRFLPVTHRAADDHAYLLAVGAVVLDEPSFKLTPEAPPELFWLAGADGLRRYEEMPVAPPAGSQAFPEAGAYVLRAGDAYLLLSASGAGLAGRGSHAHNDALSVEVSAGGACFVRDPGTYVYTADPRQRHLFRSTAYHSTVEVDGREQNTIDERLPFVIGDEARPRLLRWEDDDAHTLAVVEHAGYKNLPAGAVTHRRAVFFDKRRRFWRVEDALEGSGRHAFRFFFHLAPGTAAALLADGNLEVCDKISAARLFVVPPRGWPAPSLEPRHSSRDYGAKEESVAACWAVERAAPLRARWLLVPVGAGERAEERLELIKADGSR
ncbi:MAG TPA: alginate lyase family protein, partial [Pyrinomonadaceae bacterium]|nr:alginate lyase family protein [Pyrinomonadaceae bacterium]